MEQIQTRRKGIDIQRFKISSTNYATEQEAYDHVSRVIRQWNDEGKKDRKAYQVKAEKSVAGWLVIEKRPVESEETVSTLTYKR